MKGFIKSIRMHILSENIAIKPYINRYIEFRYWFGQQRGNQCVGCAHAALATNQRRASDRCARNTIVFPTIVWRTKLGWHACESKHMNGTLLYCNKITAEWWYTLFANDTITATLRRRYRMTQYWWMLHSIPLEKEVSISSLQCSNSIVHLSSTSPHTKFPTTHTY